MRAAVVGELAVDEGVVLFAEAVSVREDQLQRLRAVMERLVQLFKLSLVVDQVQQAVLGDDLGTVQFQGQSGVEIGVHAQAAQHVLLAELKLFEDVGVGREAHVGAVALRRGTLSALLRDEIAALEKGFGIFAVAVGAHLELCGECVHRLGADAVHAHRKLEDIIAELAAGVDLRDAVHHLAQRDAAAVVADNHLAGVVRQGDLDPFAVAHD